MLPSVVVIAWKTFTLRPASSRTLPLVVVIGALTFTSRPQQATRLPLVAVIAALMLTSRWAFNVRVVGVEDAVQAMASLTWMSPLPGWLAPGPVSVLITTLVVTSWAERVAPEILPPAPMVKSAGSISHVPVSPPGASVVMRVSVAIFTVPAEVSMKPPSPPSGALASRTPPTFSTPLGMSPKRRIVPLRSPIVRAWITPVLFTTVRSSSPAPWAVITTRPPSACIMPPFWTRAPAAPRSTTTLRRPSPATSSVIASPAARTMVPRLAWIRPSLLTWPPSRATYPPLATMAPWFSTAPEPEPVRR